MKFNVCVVCRKKTCNANERRHWLFVMFSRGANLLEASEWVSSPVEFICCWKEIDHKTFRWFVFGSQLISIRRVSTQKLQDSFCSFYWDRSPEVENHRIHLLLKWKNKVFKRYLIFVRRCSCNWVQRAGITPLSVQAVCTVNQSMHWRRLDFAVGLLCFPALWRDFPVYAALTGVVFCVENHLKPEEFSSPRTVPLRAHVRGVYVACSYG